MYEDDRTTRLEILRGVTVDSWAVNIWLYRWLH